MKSGQQPPAIAPPLRGELTAPTPELTVAPPAIIEQAGPRVVERTAEINNANTRRAYGRAAVSFFTWMVERGLALEVIRPVHVAGWVQSQQRPLGSASLSRKLMT